MKQNNQPDVMNYAAVVMTPKRRPVQTELAGADDFNLIGDEAREYVPPPPPDTTLDLPI